MTTATKPKSRGIIFTGESIPQIIAGTKTQTRRLVKPQPTTLPEGRYKWMRDPMFGRAGFCVDTSMIQAMQTMDWVMKALPSCPYTVGMLLWVRETIQKYDRTPPTAQYRADLTGVVGKYAPPISDLQLGCDLAGRAVWRWKRDTLSPRYMPRWASRLTLEVTGVGIERVQEISEADAKAEGVEAVISKKMSGWWPHQLEFCLLWDSLHAKPKPKPVKRGGKIVRYESFPWDADYKELEYRGLPHLVYGNPYVWAITFKRVEQEGPGDE